MAVSEAFVDALGETLGFVPEFRIKRMFGGVGVFSGEMMFALAIDDVLYLKADAENASRFDQQGLEPFLYARKGAEAISLGYRRAPDEIWDDPETAHDWAHVAVGAASRARARKAPKRRKAEPDALFTGPWDED